MKHFWFGLTVAALIAAWCVMVFGAEPGGWLVRRVSGIE